MRVKTTVTVRVDKGDDERTKVKSEGSHSSGVIYHDEFVGEGADVKSEKASPTVSRIFPEGNFSHTSEVPGNPYIIEPARSSRMECNACHEKIGPHELRFGAYVENFDRYVYRHLSCMTNTQRGNMRRAGYVCYTIVFPSFLFMFVMSLRLSLGLLLPACILWHHMTRV
jgi:hypothetical protein